MPILARLLAPGAVYHLLLLAAFVVVFALIPLTIYLHSGEDWHFRPFLLAELAAIGGVVFLAAALAVRLLAAAHPSAARWVASAIYCLGLFALAAHVYAPVTIGPLDGSEITSPEPGWYSTIEILLLALLLLVFLRLAHGRDLVVAGWFATLLLVVTGGYFVAAMPVGSVEQERRAPRAQAASLAGNVYHIVLDTLQTDAFLAALERRPELVERLRGFDLFRNNISNYTTTRPSAASYFTSTLYDDPPYIKWVWTWRKEGLLDKLWRSGYQIWMYSPFTNWTNKFTDHYWNNVDIYEREIGGARTPFYDFLYVWLISLAPNALTSEALEPAAVWRDRLWRWTVGPDLPLSIADGVGPYAGVLMMRQLRRDEDLRPADGQYVYAHAALPHGPWVMDRHCRYVGKPEGGRRDMPGRQSAYLDQTECALALLEAFLDRLVELGRYDPATIIVHADTGHGVGFIGSVPDGGPHGSTLGSDNATLLSLVNALLMIKRPFASHALAIRESPTQLIDLFPTVLDVLQLAPPKYPLRGTSVYAIRPGEQRSARFAFDPEEKHGPNLIEILIEDQTDLQHSKLTVLGPATDPASWRDQVDGTSSGGRPDVTLRDERRGDHR